MAEEQGGLGVGVGEAEVGLRQKGAGSAWAEGGDPAGIRAEERTLERVRVPLAEQACGEGRRASMPSAPQGLKQEGRAKSAGEAGEDGPVGISSSTEGGDVAYEDEVGNVADPVRLATFEVHGRAGLKQLVGERRQQWRVIWCEAPRQVGGDLELPGRKDLDMSYAASGREWRGPLVKIAHGAWRAQEHVRAGESAPVSLARTPCGRRRKPVGGSRREGGGASGGRGGGGGGGGPEAGRRSVPRDASEPPGEIASQVVPSDLRGPRMDVEELADAARVAVGVKPRGGGAAAGITGVRAIARFGIASKAGGNPPPGAPRHERWRGRRRGGAGGGTASAAMGAAPVEAKPVAEFVLARRAAPRALWVPHGAA